MGYDEYDAVYYSLYCVKIIFNMIFALLENLFHYLKTLFKYVIISYLINSEGLKFSNNDPHYSLEHYDYYMMVGLS